VSAPERIWIVETDPITGQRCGEWGAVSEFWPERNWSPDRITEYVRADLAQPSPDFQSRVAPWMQACFGAEISSDRIERNHRFLEEALELVQSNGCTENEAHQLVAYVYGRDQGDVNQEVGGVMVTLAALCLASGIDMHEAGETELARVWTKVEQIRAKQAAKPKHSPLPQPQQAGATDAIVRAEGIKEGLLNAARLIRCDCCDFCGESPDYEAPCANVLAERIELLAAGKPCSLADARAALSARQGEGE
jgi:NTP pyrophosphatase (non-canonical NTP hydrolase)